VQPAILRCERKVGTLTAIISALAAIIASAGAIFLTKQKERDALWRAKKLAYYETPPSEAQTRFASAINNLHLIGSEGVIKALHDFCDEIAASNPHKTKERHDVLWSLLVWEIRADLGEPPTSSPSTFRAILWASGTRPKQTSHKVDLLRGSDGSPGKTRHGS
jgi:hypothetical protein